MLLITLALVVVAERASAQEQIETLTNGAEAGLVRRIVVNIPALQLELFENEQLVKSYSIAVGKPSTPTPTGTFRVVTQVKNPTWYGPEGPVKPGPANPIGTRWIGLDKKTYGIHGTNAPKSIGRAASHGCIRMRNEDVEELFELVSAGDEVSITSAIVAGVSTTSGSTGGGM